MISALASLIDAEPDLGGRSLFELRRLATVSLRVQSWLASFDGALAAAVTALPDSSDAVAENIATAGGRRDKRHASAIVDRAKACGVVPEIGAALAAGECSSDHVDALGAATRHLDAEATARFAERGATLVAEARFDTPAEFARRCRDLATVVSADGGLARHERLRSRRAARRWSDPDGMCHTKLSLDPLADAQVWAAINELVDSGRGAGVSDDERSSPKRCADALVELCTSGGAGRRRAPEVSVVIDLDTLIERAGEHGRRLSETSDGKPLPAATIRRLCCDAEILPIVLGGDSQPLDVGRSQRLATADQRRALCAVYATCAHPGCRVGFDACRIHHVRWWHEHGGRTDFDNLVPLCERHHHLVHEGGWTLTMTADRVTTWRLPTGAVVHHVDSRNRRPPVQAAAVRQPGNSAPRRQPDSPSVVASATRQQSPARRRNAPTASRRRRTDVAGPQLIRLWGDAAERGPPVAG